MKSVYWTSWKCKSKPQCGIISHRMVIITKTRENSVAKDVGKMQPLCTVGRDINWFSHYGKQYAGSSKQLQIELPYEIKPVNPKGNQFWIFLARTDAEAETPTLWPPDWKSWLTGKGPDAGKDRRQEEKGITEIELFGWHHQLDGYEFENASGMGDGQGSLACCSPCGRRVRHNWVTELNDPAIPLLGLYIQRKLNDYLEDIC